MLKEWALRSGRNKRRIVQRYTKKACERKITDCQFADDAAHFYHQDQVQTNNNGIPTNSQFGFTASIAKTKHMVTGRLVEEND